MTALTNEQKLKWLSLFSAVVYYTVSVFVTAMDRSGLSLPDLISEIPTHTYSFQLIMAEMFGYCFTAAILLMLIALPFKKLRNSSTMWLILLLWVIFGTFLQLINR